MVFSTLTTRTYTLQVYWFSLWATCSSWLGWPLRSPHRFLPGCSPAHGKGHGTETPEAGPTKSCSQRCCWKPAGNIQWNIREHVHWQEQETGVKLQEMIITTLEIREKREKHNHLRNNAKLTLFYMEYQHSLSIALWKQVTTAEVGVRVEQKSLFIKSKIETGK